MQLGYRGPLELQLPDAICDADCGSSLKAWYDSVAISCARKTLDGFPPMLYGGYMWAGWNETCVRDPRPPKACCNGIGTRTVSQLKRLLTRLLADIIENFTTVPDVQSMPRVELCHTCHIRRLAMMQSSAYSIYDEVYKERLEHVYEKCGSKGLTDIPPPLKSVQPEPAPYCVTNKRYTTTEGDTCESISNHTSVSSAALYMGSQDLLRDC